MTVFVPGARARNHQARLPFNIQPDEKSMLGEPMPHYYSWCFGWEEMVRKVAKAYNRVPAEDRPDTKKQPLAWRRGPTRF
jgi:hypothetical protein